MKSMIDQAFRRYGMTVTVEHGAETGEASCSPLRR